jgi:WD40 repeat protein/serine/threonine protein kinase
MQPADREEALFAAALEKPTPAERAAYLDGACGSDHALRARIEALLAAHAASGGVLDAPPDALTSTGGYLPLTEGPGTVIGRYKLLQQIGEGGMGVVYMAEQQEPVRRKVALKIIKPGMDSRQVIARFEAERQALALMDHQNIAKVLDAGTIGCGPLAPREGGQPLAEREDHSGRPYFVMELVHGVKITKFCDDRKLTPRERLRLFIPVCQAIQHAHQKGIIHRDIKPSNVLVTMYDDKPVPKVIDFGVAKAVEQRLTEKTMFTQFGALVGTYEYMSPEQAEMNAFGVDTRSDVYSLGVVLYELLTGTTPLGERHLREASLDQMLRLIKEEEAPPPSKKLSSSNNLPKIAAARGTEPARLSRLVRGEIDWIVMKCLEKDRSRRYDTASGLARDVERYLADEPVEACPPSARYLLSKFARKHRKALATAAAFAVVLVAATVLSVCLALWAVSAEKEADQRRIASEEAEGRALAAKDEADRRREEARFNQYVAQMNLVQQEYEDGNIGRVRELLDAQVPREAGQTDCRGFEWYYWQRMSHRELLTFKRQTGGMWSIAFSLDGKPLAADAHEGSLRVWDAATGRELLAAHGRRDEFDYARLSPDGRRLAAAGSDGQMRLWDVATGHELPTPKGLVSTLASVQFSRDSRRLAAQGGTAQPVQVWDLATGQALPALRGYRELGRGRWLLSPDGRRLASWGQQTGNLRVWDTDTGQELPRPANKPMSWAAAFSPDGRRLAVAESRPDAVVRVCQVDTGRELFPLRGHSADIRGAQFSPNGHLLASMDSEGSVRLWDATNGQQLHTLRKGNARTPFSMVFSPDGGRLATRGGPDSPVVVWDTTSGKELCTLYGLMSETYDMVFSPDGWRLATASTDDTVRVWDAATGQERLTLEGVASPWIHDVAFSADGERLSWVRGDATVRAADITTGRPLGMSNVLAGGLGYKLSPDGQRLAAAGTDGAVWLWDAENGRKLLVRRGHTGLVIDVAFSAAGRRMASAGRDGTVRVWDAGSGQLLHELRVSLGLLLRVVLSPDGRRLASWGDDGALRLWDVASGREMHVLSSAWGRVGVVAFSPDGHRLACAGEDRSIRLFDADSGRVVRVLTGHAYYHAGFGVRALVFSPDGRRLAAAGAGENTVRLWDMSTGQELLTLKKHEEAIQGVAFSRDGLRLASWTRRAVYVWEASPVSADDWRRRAIANQVRAFFAEGLLREEVLAALRKASDLSESDRAFAVQAAEIHGEDAGALNEKAWKVVTTRGAARDAYALALRRAEAAFRAAPEDGPTLNTLGVAQYRAGRYAEAERTLNRSNQLGLDQLKRKMGVGPSPEDLAFLAMAQYQLGNRKAAAGTLTQLRAMMRQPLYAGNVEWQGHWTEAEALLAQPANPQGK